MNDSTCFTLLVEKKVGYVDTVPLTPFFHPNGFYILKNGIYHFDIKGKKYTFYRVTKMTSDSISIARGVEEVPEITFSPSDIYSLKFYSQSEGHQSWPPYFIKPADYKFKLIQQKEYCLVPKVNICTDKDCSIFYLAYQFMTMGTGWKLLYKKGNKYYMKDGTKILRIYLKE
jgi:hypothetical protein